MTMFKPTLILDELSIFRNGKTVFNCAFRKGVNIISAQNSSGKTTIMDFVAYTLGAENIPWKPQALLCDYCVAQISLNGTPVTIKRDINTKIQNPLSIFWGPIQAALDAPFTSWETFPFRRSTQRISFTQAILLAMDLPEAQGDGASNLTMHQFLRVLYADQPSLHSPIFRTDNFDSELTRETVGNYLCGIYDDNLYAAQLEKRSVDKLLNEISAELKSIYSVLARSGQDVSIEFFSERILELENERNNLIDLLRDVKTRRIAQSTDTSADIAKLRQELNDAKAAMAMAQSSLSRSELEIADSERFIEELNLRLRGVEESVISRKFFGSINFSFCPCCLKELPPQTTASDSCSLCKSPLEVSPADSQVLRMKNELRIQLLESQELISTKTREIFRLKADIPTLIQNLKILEQQFKNSATTWSSELETAVESLSKQIGGLDQEIKGLYETQKLALIIRELQGKREAYQNQLTELSTKIERLEFSQAERQKQVAFTIADTLGKLLRKDLHRQQEFKEANHVTFSFADNQITVDGASKFSESSTVVLRHLFHVALLSASTEIPEMRLPRFMMLDGIEDGGMELQRSYLLQKIIVNTCETFNVDYQLIFATSQIAPELNNSEYLVGRFFTEHEKSLNIL